MIDYGYKDYQMHIGEHLGNPVKESVTSLSLEAVTEQEFAHPNCLTLTTNNWDSIGL